MDTHEFQFFFLFVVVQFCQGDDLPKKSEIFDQIQLAAVRGVIFSESNAYVESLIEEKEFFMIHPSFSCSESWVLWFHARKSGVYGGFYRPRSGEKNILRAFIREQRKIPDFNLVFESLKKSISQRNSHEASILHLNVTLGSEGKLKEIFVPLEPNKSALDLALEIFKGDKLIAKVLSDYSVSD